MIAHVLDRLLPQVYIGEHELYGKGKFGIPLVGSLSITIRYLDFLSEIP